MALVDKLVSQATKPEENTFIGTPIPIEDVKQIPVIGVPIVNGYDWLEKLIKSIDYPVKNLVIVNNNGSDKKLTRQLNNLIGNGGLHKPLIDKIHVINFPTNMGVAFAWNCIIKSFILEPFWIISNHDVEFTPGLLQEMFEAALDDKVCMVHPHRGNYTQGSFDLFLIKENAIREVGLFDENLYPAYGEDSDYIMRIKNTQAVRVLGLNRIHKHGGKVPPGAALGSYVGTVDDYIKSKPIEEINEENYDESYFGVGGQTRKAGGDHLGARLTDVNWINYDYLNRKWGEYWRGTCPYDYPMNNPEMPQSYTTFDIDFVRKKHLGF